MLNSFSSSLCSIAKRQKERRLHWAVHTEEPEKINTICSLQPPSGICCHQRSLTQELCPDFLRLDKLTLNNGMHCYSTLCNKVDNKSSFQDVNNSTVVVSKRVSTYPYMFQIIP